MRDARDDYSRLWQDIKKGFTKRVLTSGEILERGRRREYRLWQRRFWEHTIRDDNDLNAHVDYVHINPLRHGLVTRVVDWPHSTFHRYVQADWLPRDWGGQIKNTDDFGEPK